MTISWTLPFGTNVNNVVKFAVINLLLLPLIELTAYMVSCRLATLFVLNGGRARIRETNAGLFGLHSHYWGRRQWQSFAILAACAFLALSLMGEYGFDSTSIDKVKPANVLTPVVFTDLIPLDVRNKVDYSWFLRQTSTCTGNLRPKRQRDKLMQEKNRAPRTQTRAACLNWTRTSTLREDAIARYVNACKEAGPKTIFLNFVFMNWTQSVRIREGAMTVAPEYQTVCLGNTKRDVQTHGLLFGLVTHFHMETMLMEQNPLEHLFALEQRRKYIPALTFDLKAIDGNFGRANRTRLVFVVLEGKDSSCSGFINNTKTDLLCLTTTKGLSVRGPETVLRIAFTKGKPTMSEFKKNSTVTVDVRALWAYVEIPALERDSREVLAHRRTLFMYMIATWPRLAYMSGRYEHDTFLDDIDMVRLAEVLFSTMARETLPFDYKSGNTTADAFVSEVERATMNTFAVVFFGVCACSIVLLLFAILTLNVLINRKVSQKGPDGDSKRTTLRSALSLVFRTKWVVKFSADWLMWKAGEERKGQGLHTKYEDTGVAIGLTDEGASYHIGIVPSIIATVPYGQDKPIR